MRTLTPTSLALSVTKQDGMSLVELMVGVVIGMLTVLAVANTITISEGQRRGTSTGADAQVNATIATYMVERDTRMAGYGLFKDANAANSILGACDTGVIRAYNQNRSPASFNYDVKMFSSPVLINPASLPAGDAETDVIQINYAGSGLGPIGKPTSFEQQSGASANYKVDTRVGFRTGDLVIAAQSGKDCSVAEITGLPGDPKCGDPGNQTNVIIHNNGQYNNSYKNCSKVDSEWNKPGGLGVDYTVVGNVKPKLFNIGPPDSYVSVAYAVRGGRLTRCDAIANDCTGGTADANIWQPVADGVVMLRAEMGLDTDSNQSIETWRGQPCATANCTPAYNEWMRLKGVRIAVVARSQQYEKDEVTTAAPTWQGQTALKIDQLADWKHYRYSTIEVIAPIRNVVWPSSIPEN